MMTSPEQQRWLRENSHQKNESSLIESVLAPSNAGGVAPGTTPTDPNPAPEVADIFTWRARQILARAGHNSLLDLERSQPSPAPIEPDSSPDKSGLTASSTEMDEGSDIGYCRDVVLRY